MKIFSTQLFRAVEHKSLTLYSVILHKNKMRQIEEWASELNYEATFMDFPQIKSENKSMFIQEEEDMLYLVEALPIFDDELNVIGYSKIKENLSEMLEAYNLWKMVKAGFFPKTILKNGELIPKMLFGVQYFNSNKLKPIML